MNRFNAGLVLSALLVSAITTAQTVEKPAPSKTPQSLFQVKVSIGTLSLDAKDAPLAKVFKEIGRQAGIAVEGNVDPAETVTMRFDKVPLEEGIKRLSNNVTIHYGDKPNEKGHRITKIVVLSEDKRKVTRSQDAKAVKPSIASEPEPRPEPFKFEFDPTKSVEKPQRK
jgi:hypothetical protein